MPCLWSVLLICLWCWPSRCIVLDTLATSCAICFCGTQCRLRSPYWIKPIHIPLSWWLTNQLMINICAAVYWGYRLYKRRSFKVFVKFWLWSVAVFGSVFEMIMKLEICKIWQMVFYCLCSSDYLSGCVNQNAWHCRWKEETPISPANGREIPRLGGWSYGGGRKQCI